MHTISGPANRDIQNVAKKTDEFTLDSNKGSQFSNALNHIENTANDLVAGAPYPRKTQHDILVSIIATGILKADFASKMGIPPDTIAGASYADPRHTGKALTADETVKLLENVLKTVRFLYKGSLIKSSNKIKNDSRYDEMAKRVQHRVSLRSLAETSLDKALYYCVEHEFGNCGEMAHIAYALSHQLGLKPELADFKSDGEFGHQVCRVKVGDTYYILDIWANILSDEKEYLNLLWQKMTNWDISGKHILNGKNFKIRSDEEFKIPLEALVSPDDILKLKLVKSEPIKGEHNIVSADFFTFLGDKLAEKCRQKN